MVLETLKHLPARCLIALVRVYRFILSPFMGQSCRFTPSCSHYTEEAIKQHGALRGALLGIIRICKCQPFYKGGWVDDVPARLPSWTKFGRRNRTEERDKENEQV
jgi:uncharacterized protein